MALPNMKHEEKKTADEIAKEQGANFSHVGMKVAESKEVAKIEPVASTVVTKLSLPEGMESRFRVKRRITVPHLKHKISETVYVRFEHPYVKAEDRLDEVTGEVQKGPFIADITDLKTGEACTYIINAVTRGLLDKIDGGYVGKSFAIRKNDQVTDRPMGRRFCPMDILELE
jgi:hypothetical protein